jgi:hypothetical protein
VGNQQRGKSYGKKPEVQVVKSREVQVVKNCEVQVVKNREVLQADSGLQELSMS